MEKLELVEKNGCLYAMKEDGTMLNILVYVHESQYYGYLMTQEQKDGDGDAEN